MFHISPKMFNLRLKAVILACITISLSGCTSAVSGDGEGFTVVDSNFLGVVWNHGHAKVSILSQDGG